MKFANLRYKAKGMADIGNNLQILAIENVYATMGLRKNEIVSIDADDLYTYDGDYVILPIALQTPHFSIDFLRRLSPKILPVFLCFSTSLSSLPPQDAAFLAKHEPIGCLDAHTTALLQSHGIRAYLNGCLTALFPKAAAPAKARGKTFLVDVPDELLHAMPAIVQNGAVHVSHLVKANGEDLGPYAAELYKRYKNEAALVVTSQLHCAAPCVAAGIPVVLACSHYSSSFSWIDKILPVYTPEQYDDIDWNPEPTSFELLKPLILSTTIRRLQEALRAYNDIYTISWFFENFDRSRPEVARVLDAKNK